MHSWAWLRTSVFVAAGTGCWLVGSVRVDEGVEDLDSPTTVSNQTQLGHILAQGSAAVVVGKQDQHDVAMQAAMPKAPPEAAGGDSKAYQDAVATMKKLFNTSGCARTTKGLTQHAFGCKADCVCEGLHYFVDCYPKRLPDGSRYVDVGVCEMSADAHFLAAFVAVGFQVMVFLVVMQQVLQRLPTNERAALMSRGRGESKDA
eukprot:TRINITY_DN51471_c0_g1_i1.p1 TRINITY_DN51471_c0_g1~~TRINITY_DN51471_c0_g1_i1.p1  ORF type:complete len:203 (+),score=55.93 TRINITY_DN51471_c0_g1_i1:133-741(+)